MSFLADLGGLYCISIAIFFFLLVQCEHRIKRLRNDDQVLRDMRRRCKAQDNWEKLRKYVMYTWNPPSVVEENNDFSSDGCCTCPIGDPFRKNEALHRRSLRESSLRSVSFDKNTKSKEMVKKHVKEPTKSVSVFVPSAHKDDNLPPLPTLPEFNGGSPDVSDIQKSLQDLYEYNAMLRDKLDNTLSMLRALAANHPSTAS